MLTFTDLIKQNIAPSPYKTNVINDSSDRICINYNNIWGILTDTHMSKGEDGKYYITGSLLKNKTKTVSLVNYTTWGGVYFGDSSVNAVSLSDYAHKNHLLISHDIVNGDDVLVLTPMDEDEIKWYEETCTGQCVYAQDVPYIDKKTQKDKDMSTLLCFEY